MPYHISAIDSGRGMYCRATGKMLGQEVLSEMHRAHPAWVGKLDYIIIDLRNLDEAVSTPDQRRDLLDLELEFSKRHPDIVLVGIAITDLQFGIARMWEQMLQPTGWMVRATHGLHEALQTLQTALAVRGRPPASPGIT